MKSIIVLFSYHHKNTEKIASVIAKVLGAEIKTPHQINPEMLQEYDLIGFGSGIYDAKHHTSILDLADKLPQASNKKTFIFSTCGIPTAIVGRKLTDENTRKSHSALREKLQTKGYTIIGEFGCAGFNTNVFLKYFGGINKKRPNNEDLKNAEEFARKLKGRTSQEK